jgi:hypothetical protein
VSEYEQHIKDEIVTRYRDERDTVRRIARDFRSRGLPSNENDLRQILRDAGLMGPGKPWGVSRVGIPNLEEYGERALYEPVEEIAKELGICGDTLRRRLQEANLLPRGRVGRRLLPKPSA